MKTSTLDLFSETEAYAMQHIRRIE
jgi:hypothetical protein